MTGCDDQQQPKDGHQLRRIEGKSVSNYNSCHVATGFTISAFVALIIWDDSTAAALLGANDNNGDDRVYRWCNPTIMVDTSTYTRLQRRFSVVLIESPHHTDAMWTFLLSFGRLLESRLGKLMINGMD